jgi:hypothetical protein
MKKLLGIVVLGFFIYNTSSYAGSVNGSGELKMSNGAVNAFINYIKINKKVVNGKRAKPDSFIISSNGDWTWYWWCAHNECWTNDKPKLEECERKTGVSCARFAKRRTIYWDNGINTKKKKARFTSKMSDQEIRDELKKLGFIETNGSTLTNKPKITKKSPDIAKQLTQIKKLYDDGILTKEEYEKAKKKIIN